MQKNIEATLENPNRLMLLMTPFKAYCCHMGTAIKHPVPDWAKPSFVIFDIRAL